MKTRKFRLLCFFLFFFVCCLQLVGQERSILECDADPVVLPGEYPSNAWTKIENKYYSMAIPKEFVPRGKKCLDGLCSSFESEDRFINVDINTGVRGLTFEKTKPGYVEKAICVNEKPSLMWSFEHDGSYKFVSGVILDFDAKQKMAVTFLSKHKDSQEIAEKVFKSVRIGRPKT